MLNRGLSEVRVVLRRRILLTNGYLSLGMLARTARVLPLLFTGTCLVRTYNLVMVV